MRSTPLLPSIPGSLWPRVVTPDRVQSMGQIELNCILHELFEIELFLCIKMDFALNNQQWLIFHKTRLKWFKSCYVLVIYKAFFFCLDLAQGRMNGAPNKTRTHSCWVASQELLSNTNNSI